MEFPEDVKWKLGLAGFALGKWSSSPGAYIAFPARGCTLSSSGP